MKTKIPFLVPIFPRSLSYEADIVASLKLNRRLFPRSLVSHKADIVAPLNLNRRLFQWLLRFILTVGCPIFGDSNRFTHTQKSVLFAAQSQIVIPFMMSTHLTVDQRSQILQLLDDGSSERACAKKFNVGKGTINRLKRSRETIETLTKEGDTNLKKRKNSVMRPKFKEIEEIVVKFLSIVRERGLAVTGPMLRSLAEREARKRGITNFQASEGWLSKVKRRHGIIGKYLSGEAGGVDKVTAEKWKEDLPKIISGYHPSDIYNCDETALLYKQTTTKSLLKTSDQGHGQKRDKSRVSLLLCASWMGEKEKVLLIARSKNPRALQGANKAKLPVVYHSQGKAWMTGNIFTSWICDFDRRMREQKRRILLFMDNAAVHNVDVNLTNIRVVFFPKNTTSCLQPLDAGVIQSFKLNYRKHVNNHILNMMMDESTIEDNPFKSVNLAVAIVWVFRAWRDVNRRTISKCFVNCGFFSDGQESNEEIPNEPTCITSDEERLATEEMDDDNIFPAEVAPEVLFDEIINGSQAEAVQLSDGEETKEEETVIPSSKDALAAIKLIQLYALGRGDEQVLGGVCDLTWYQGVIESRRAQEQVQSRITDFFVKQ